MSWQVLGLVARKTLGSAARKLVLLSMADKANDDGGGVWASMATIAAWADVSRDTAKRIVREFLDEGLIVQVGTRPCTNGVTVIYDLVLARIEALSDAVKPETAKSNSPKPTRGKMHPVQDAPGADSTRCTEPHDPVHHAPPPGAPCTTNLSLNLSKNPLSLSPGGDEGGEKGAEANTEAKGKPKPPVYTDDFEAAWKWWPRKGRERSSKAKSFETWKEALRVYTLDGVRAAFRAYAREAQRENGQYVPAMEKWLRVNGPISTWIEEAGLSVPEAGRVETKRGAPLAQPTWDDRRKLWVYPDGSTKEDPRRSRNVVT